MVALSHLFSPAQQERDTHTHREQERASIHHAPVCSSITVKKDSPPPTTCQPGPSPNPALTAGAPRLSTLPPLVSATSSHPHPYTWWFLIFSFLGCPQKHSKLPTFAHMPPCPRQSSCFASFLRRLASAPLSLRMPHHPKVASPFSSPPLPPPLITPTWPTHAGAISTTFERVNPILLLVDTPQHPSPRLPKFTYSHRFTTAPRISSLQPPPRTREPHVPSSPTLSSL